MDEVWSAEFGQERRDDIGQEDHALRHIGTNEIESSGEDDDIQNIVDEA